MKIKRIAIVGAPNVGKSSIFNHLSGRYATVSNYPGTTVEVFKASALIKGVSCEIIDTPGMYSLLSLSEEERITRRMILSEHFDVIMQVVAACDLERSLPLTIQLIEAGLPVILVLNIMDEASREGYDINIEKLQSRLGISVIPTVSVRGRGMKELREVISDAAPASRSRLVTYSESIEEGVEELRACLKGTYRVSVRTIATLLLEADPDIIDYARSAGEDSGCIERIKNRIQEKNAQPLEYLVHVSLKVKAHALAGSVTRHRARGRKKFLYILDDLTLKPLLGLPLLFLFLYFGLYKLVGEFGAGTVVTLLEKGFMHYVNPACVKFFNALPWPVVSRLFVGEYGIVTLGIRYAVAIVLPIVGIFFLVFSFAEDTGYLPRMGAMLDRLFKRIGLSGRAVIPLVLGLGCDTMATMVTRVLPSRRERIIATFLLSLSVPCSAQLGVIMAVLAPRKLGLLIWFVTITIIFALSGFMLNKILKGKKPSFYIELPPLRLPRFDNIMVKTYTRLVWYFKEVLPLFIIASVLIWVGQITKIFDLLLRALRYPLALIGLPESFSQVFLFGFFRRDYGAAGLYDLDRTGALSLREVVVCTVVLTLFLPCIAQLLMNIKERGLKMALSITVFVLVFSFGAGFLLNKVLLLVGF
ncbi:MAG: ferrous iron transport protein B [Candidatus Omnitrophota bacterium]